MEVLLIVIVVGGAIGYGLSAIINRILPKKIIRYSVQRAPTIREGSLR